MNIEEILSRRQKKRPPTGDILRSKFSLLRSRLYDSCAGHESIAPRYLCVLVGRRVRCLLENRLDVRGIYRLGDYLYICLACLFLEHLECIKAIILDEEDHYAQVVDGLFVFEPLVQWLDLGDEILELQFHRHIICVNDQRLVATLAKALLSGSLLDRVADLLDDLVDDDDLMAPDPQGLLDKLLLERVHQEDVGLTTRSYRVSPV